MLAIVTYGFMMIFVGEKLINSLKIRLILEAEFGDDLFPMLDVSQNL